MGVARYLRQGKSVQVIIAVFWADSDDTRLLSDLQCKYLPHINSLTSDVIFTTMRSLDAKYNIEYDLYHPQAVINTLMNTISATNSDKQTILMVDESSAI